MLPTVSQVSPASAATLRQRLWALEGERHEALAAGLGANTLYMDDLHREIEQTREAFAGSAVTEIAVLRGLLSGRLSG
jgi:DnaJ-domain-containing protein 1